MPSRRLVRAADGVVELPSALRGARVSPSVLAVIGAAIVVVIAVGWFFVTVRGDDAGEPVPTTRVTAEGLEEAAGQGVAPGPPVVGAPAPTAATPPPGGEAPPAAPAADIYVHVVGHVANPGVVTLPAGSRVSDAVEKAGGPTSAAVLSGLNLARVLVDGEQVVVPNAEGEPRVPIALGPPPPGAPAPPADPAGALVDINTADQATLETLPKVGPVIAERIIEHRTANGPFASVDDLKQVKGVGAKILEEIRPKARV
ncbi:MAG: ComEA family DNA-binding protein [Mobilicoccus sp.]|nr:ComEA family DNA-binding protein [Mobilicoccus sp.]